jgi:hypothetical protein
MPVSESSLNLSLQWIKENVEEGGAYVIIVKANEAVLPANRGLSYDGKTVSVTLSGDGVERIISLGAEKGTLFTVSGGVTLALEKNVTLRGLVDNNASLVVVDGGVFTMNGGKISDNTADGYGGGVYVKNGTFTMNGGKISNNVNTFSAGGGGVQVTDSGAFFIMNGGEISGNTALAFGGGVQVKNGTFTMKDGQILDNTATGGYGGGGGVYVTNSAFTKTGGTIYGDASNIHKQGSTANTATSPLGGSKYGHAVFLEKPNKEYYYRNETLEVSDNITTDTLPATSGETKGNWTKW